MKIRRLICLLLVIVLLMSCFWILADMPAFTAEGAFYRAERRSFLQESTFLGADFLGKTHVSGSGIPSGSLFDYAAVGKTDSALHITELRKKPPFSRWYANEEMVTIPLTEELTAEWEPFHAEYWAVNLLVYTPLAFDRGQVTLSVNGGAEYQQDFTPTESGLIHVGFPELRHSEEGRQIQWRQFDLRSIRYDESQKTQDVLLTVVLYNSKGQRVAGLERLYPKYE